MSEKLLLGYSPFDCPSYGKDIIYPFNEIFDEGVNLINATDEEIKKCYALVLWGGSDICTKFYGEDPISYSGPAHPSARDVFEWELIRRFVDNGRPIIGVCRGAQLLCAAAGGKLIQNVAGHNNGNHLITTNDGQEFSVSSAHHQMMYPYDTEHELLAWSTQHLSTVYMPMTTEHAAALDKRHVKEPEVVYFNDLNALAIQCHPEWHREFKGGGAFNQWIFNIILERWFD